MRKIACPLLGCIAAVLLAYGCKESSGKSALTAVSFDRVVLEDSFWLPRLQTQIRTLVPFSLEKTEPAVENLRRTAAVLRGDSSQCLLPLARYVASDLFKVMEGAAYLLTIQPDSQLEQRMDKIIEVIGSAQCPDGYLFEMHTVGPKLVERWDDGVGKTPYSYVVHSHELYNMGHMYEGAVAYYRATGKRQWLDIAEKSARHINKVFFYGDSAYNGGKPVNQAPGHEELELALVKLYEVTSDTLYLNMAQRFLDIRGVTYFPEGDGVMRNDYAQQHAPVQEQREAVGHSVRATYLYSGMADVAAKTGSTVYQAALDSIWHDIADRKVHITGGLGAIGGLESFGPAYVLPNRDTYDETCAGVGNVFFNYRMFLKSRDAKYVDMAEVALYNNVLAGVNMEGNRFFYVNPLETDGRRAFNHGSRGRAPWFHTACCPSNLARLIPQIPGMMYSHVDRDIYCSFYAGSRTSILLENGEVELNQQTAYPFGGDISIEVKPISGEQNFTLWLRVPTWCNGAGFMPGALYTFADELQPQPQLLVNGEIISDARIERGFIPVRRTWKAGDTVQLSLPMPLRFNVADERVEADRDRVCLTCGPLVYCAETADNKEALNTYFLTDVSQQGEFSVVQEGVLKGLKSIRVNANAVLPEGNEPRSLTLVPYYAWNNRGEDAMNVWFPRSPATVEASLPRYTRYVKNVKATHTFQNDTEFAIADGKEPKNSADKSIPRWTGWPQLGRPQTVELMLLKPTEIESVSVYWYNDNRGVKLPKSWSMEYCTEGKWYPYKPYTTDHFGTEADKYNMVHPAAPVMADALRLHITPRSDASVGILEIEIN